MYGGNDQYIQVDSNKEDSDNPVSSTSVEEACKEVWDLETDGEDTTTTTTCKWMATNIVTTVKDGEIIMIKDFSKTFKWSSKDMIKTILVNWRDNNSSMHTEIFVSQWEWLPQIATKTSGKLFSNAIQTEMEE